MASTSPSELPLHGESMSLPVAPASRRKRAVPTDQPLIHRTSWPVSGPGDSRRFSRIRSRRVDANGGKNSQGLARQVLNSRRPMGRSRRQVEPAARIDVLRCRWAGICDP